MDARSTGSRIGNSLIASFIRVQDDCVIILHGLELGTKMFPGGVIDVNLNFSSLRSWQLTARWTILSRWSMFFSNFFNFITWIGLFFHDFFHANFPPIKARVLVLRVIGAATSMMPRRSLVAIKADISERKRFHYTSW